MMKLIARLYVDEIGLISYLIDNDSVNYNIYDKVNFAENCIARFQKSIMK